MVDMGASDAASDRADGNIGFDAAAERSRGVAARVRRPIMFFRSFLEVRQKYSCDHNRRFEQ